jgi:hypothetical protein
MELHLYFTRDLFCSLDLYSDLQTRRRKQDCVRRFDSAFDGAGLKRQTVGIIRSRSSYKQYLRLQSVPQRKHRTSPLQRSTG